MLLLLLLLGVGDGEKVIKVDDIRIDVERRGIVVSLCH